MQASLDAYRLLHDGSLVLARMESNGIRIHTERLGQTIIDVQARIEKTEAELKEHPTFARWREEYGAKTKLSSRTQFGDLLFHKLGFQSRFETTKTGRFRADGDALRSLNDPFVNKYLRYEELKKFKKTFLEGVQSEVVDGFLHPFFDLHTAKTMRSSSSRPNFQNIPRRDEELGRLIRRCFIPREGRVLVENDFSALEFRIASCFWKDPAMIAYASDKSLDIHRDMAAECYLLEPKEVTKAVRQEGKNKFVFPKIYGSYYLPMAQGLWGAIPEQKLTTVSGVPLKQHLKARGIKRIGDGNPKLPPMPGTFAHHIRQVERRFEERFPVFTRSKEEWWQSYQSTGQFRLLTGFVISGIYSRNFLMNAPIQGPGFHCLLWSLIQIQKWITKNKMKTKLVGQVHDCALADVPKNELQDYLQAVKQIITVDLPKTWSWLVVPMEIESEVAENNWHDKKQWVEVNGRWQPRK